MYSCFNSFIIALQLFHSFSGLAPLIYLFTTWVLIFFCLFELRCNNSPSASVMSEPWMGLPVFLGLCKTSSARTAAVTTIDNNPDGYPSAFRRQGPKRLQHAENAALPRNTCLRVPQVLLRRLSHPGGGVAPLLLLHGVVWQLSRRPSELPAAASATRSDASAEIFQIWTWSWCLTFPLVQTDRKMLTFGTTLFKTMQSVLI